MLRLIASFVTSSDIKYGMISHRCAAYRGDDEWIDDNF